MKKAKIIISCILVMLLSFMLVACNTQETTKEKDKSDKKTYEIKFLDEGTLVHEETVDENATIYSPSAKEKTGFIFAGWSETMGGEVASFPTVATKDMVYYAKYESKKDHNKKAFIKFMKSKEFKGGIAGFPDHYVYHSGEFDIQYAPKENKVRLFNTHDYEDKTSILIMLDWNYGSPNTMEGDFGYFPSDGTVLTCPIESVSFDTQGNMTRFDLADNSYDIDYYKSVRTYLLIVQEYVLNVLPLEITGVTSDFNLFLGY